MSIADPQPAVGKSERRWFQRTSGRFLLFLVLVYVFRLLSNRLHWFPYGCAEYFAVATAGAAMVLMLIWFAVCMVLRWPLRYRLWTLSAVVVACLIPCGWLAVKMHRAEKYRLAIEAIKRAGGSITIGDDDRSWFNRGQKLRVHSVSFAHGFPADSDLRFVGDLTDLKQLSLDDTDITDDGLRHLQGLTQLIQLSLKDCNITDAGLEPLKRLTGVKYINLRGTKVTEAGISGLRKALPSASVRWDSTYSGWSEVEYQLSRGRRKAIRQSMMSGTQEDQRAAIRHLTNYYSLSVVDVPVLLWALKDESPLVRHSAIILLGRIGPPAREAIPELRKAMYDSDSGVRNAATRAIKAIESGPVTPR